MKRWIATGLAIAATFQLWAQAPEMFLYQGRLLNGTNLVNATVPMSFKLYNSLSGGTRLYEDSNSVLVVDGLYSTYIGDNTVFGSLTNAMTNAAVYLELTVNGSTLPPRERLVSVPYALNAGGNVTRIIRLSSGVLDFGTVVTGTVKTATLTVYNDGDGVLNVTGVQSSDAGFSGDGAGRIQQLGSMNITVTFAPVLEQNYSGTATVHCDKTSGTNIINCTGNAIAVRYIDNQDGTVTDFLTGLMWIKHANCGYMSWSSAMAYCSNLVYAGYDDWRLPAITDYGGKVAELDTLFRVNGDPNENWAGWIGSAFTGIENSKYWSSSIYGTINQAGACWVNMSNGDTGGSSKSSNNYVWPVRGGQ